MNAGVFAIRLTRSQPRISCTLRMSIPYSASPSRKLRNSRVAASGRYESVVVGTVEFLFHSKKRSRLIGTHLELSALSTRSGTPLGAAGVNLRGLRVGVRAVATPAKMLGQASGRAARQPQFRSHVLRKGFKAAAHPWCCAPAAFRGLAVQQFRVPGRFCVNRRQFARRTDHRTSSEEPWNSQESTRLITPA
jgi:hypothetical protein